MNKLEINKLNTIYIYLLSISPILYLTVKSWTNVTVFILCVAASYNLYVNKQLIRKRIFNNERFAVCMVLTLPLVSIIFSQLLRSEINLQNWDSPLRYLICIPIYLAISFGCLKPKNNSFISESWGLIYMPLALLWTMFFRTNWPTVWGGVDYTTYFVDPLSFGSYTLLFSLVIITCLTFYFPRLSFWQITLSITSIVCGIYLSITSGSRTGWAFIPFFVLMWGVLVIKPKYGWSATLSLIFLLIIVITVMLLYADSGYLLNKFAKVFIELKNYKLNELNENNSTGYRLSFYRMGFTYFLEKPLLGWGDTGWITEINRPEFSIYASEDARISPIHGFHNEIITNSVRSGVWGLMSTLAFFYIFIKIGILGLKEKINEAHQIISLLILVIVGHIFIAGMTTEITNLTFLSSFIGLTLSVLLGEKLYIKEKIANYD